MKSTIGLNRDFITGTIVKNLRAAFVYIPSIVVKSCCYDFVYIPDIVVKKVVQKGCIKNPVPRIVVIYGL